MYKALYRKYRPAVFSDVVGQPYTTRALKNQLSAGRIGHAYLFTGSRGTGKTSCAKILAKAVNCLSPADGDPCGICESCKIYESGGMIDILEIDAASNSGVDNIRDLRDKVNYAPAAGKYRVYIIDEVHMLSAGAFNALLKTLEEPPAHTIFILATTESHKLPATILSRCQRFDFKRIPPEDIAKRLLFVAKEENAGLTEDAALLIARISDGALRDALSLLDLCCAEGEIITEESVARAAGLAGRDYLYSLTDAILTENCPAALEIIDKIHSASLDMGRLCTELIGHFRNILICKTGTKSRDILAVSTSELAALNDISEQLPLSAVFAALSQLEGALMRIGGGAPGRTEMELALIKLCTPSLDTSPESVNRRLDALEAAVRNSAALSSAKITGDGHSAGNNEAGKPDSPVTPPSSPDNREEALSGSAPPPPGTPVNITQNQDSADSADIPEIPADKPLPELDIFPDSASMPAPAYIPPREHYNPDPAPPKPENIPEPETPELSDIEPCRFWPELLESLMSNNPLIAAVLQKADVYISGDFLLIDPHSEKFREMVNSNEIHRKSIRDAALAVSGKQYRLGPYTKPAAPDSEKKDEDPVIILEKKLREADLLK